MNRITCTQVTGERLSLKYHWVEGLVSEPPVALEPVMLIDDPIPFIQVTRPPTRFTLRIGRNRD